MGGIILAYMGMPRPAQTGRVWIRTDMEGQNMKTVEQTLIEAGRAYTIAAASGNVIGYVGDDGAGGAQLRLGKYEHKIGRAHV